jgi:hypothetical protein
MTSQIDNPSSQFEIQRLLELLNSYQQTPGRQSPEIDPHPVRSVVAARTNAGSTVLDTIGPENRFVAHISEAMSKMKLGPFSIS